MDYKNIIKKRPYILLVVINILVIILIKGTSLVEFSIKTMTSIPILIFGLETQDSKYIKVVAYLGLFLGLFINIFLLVIVIITS